MVSGIGGHTEALEQIRPFYLGCWEAMKISDLSFGPAHHH